MKFFDKISDVTSTLSNKFLREETVSYNYVRCPPSWDIPLFIYSLRRISSNIENTHKNIKQ